MQPALETPPKMLRLWGRAPAVAVPVGEGIAPGPKLLARIAGPEAFPFPTDDEIEAARKAARAAGREPESSDALVARAATAYRVWWDESKDKLAFDPATGRWSTRK